MPVINAATHIAPETCWSRILPTVGQLDPIPGCAFPLPPSYFLGIWILLLLLNKPIETTKMESSRPSLGLQQPSKMNPSSQMELLWISAALGTRWVFKVESTDSQLRMTGFLQSVSHQAAPEHWAAAREWISLYSAGSRAENTHIPTPPAARLDTRGK